MFAVTYSNDSNRSSQRAGRNLDGVSGLCAGGFPGGHGQVYQVLLVQQALQQRKKPFFKATRTQAEQSAGRARLI
jgi:hypothetical protein